MRWGQLLLWIAIGAIVGYHVYSTSQNTIHGLTGPRFNLAVKNTAALAEIDLADEIPGFGGRRMRGRYVIVQPGATIRIHDHVGRPAFSYIVNTTVDQYRSDEKGPIHHQPGDLSADTNIAHWWRNTGGYPATFYVVDIYEPLGNKGE
jgi:quercetin dioxygenase-like cupin family protein